MLVPFLIMLREGLEAALIVGIVANYLHHTGRRALLPAVVLGVLLAIAASLLAGAALQWAAADFPQRQQELFEAVVGMVAVSILTSMVFWMRKAASVTRHGLEASVESAIRRGLGNWALVTMVFLAVAREGLESIFFLLAIFQQSPDWHAPLGALAGIALSALLGWGLYAGGLRLNLRRFFRYSGLFVLVVAAGLLASALRKLHEAGIWNIGQQIVFDSSHWLPVDGPLGVVLSGILGYQSTPVRSELFVYVLYLAVTLFLFLRPTRPPSGRATKEGTSHDAQTASAAGIPKPAQASIATAAGGAPALPAASVRWHAWVALAVVLVLASGAAFQHATGTLHRRALPNTGMQVTITIAGRTCVPDEIEVPAGLTTFTIINQTRRALEWEILDGVMVLDERENIAPGFTQTLRTRLRPGTFEMTCGLLSNPRGRLVVLPSDASRAAAARPELVQYIGLLAEYQVYQRMSLRGAVRDIEAAASAIAQGDAQAALRHTAAARAAYARLRPLAVQFDELDAVLEPASENSQGFPRLLRQARSDEIAASAEPTRSLARQLTALDGQLAANPAMPAQLLHGAARYLRALAASLETETPADPLAWAVLQGAHDGTSRIAALFDPLLEQAAPTRRQALTQAFDAWHTALCIADACQDVRLDHPDAAAAAQHAPLLRNAAHALAQAAEGLGLEEPS